MSHPYKRYKKQVSNLQSYFFFLPGCDMRELTCFFFPSAIKASESRYPPWHVQPKPKTKTFDLKIAWAEPSKRPHVMSDLEKIASNLAETVTHDCWRLLAVAHGCSRSLIFFVSIYIVAIIAENVPFEVLGPYFLGPLSICSRLLKLTIAHDCSRFMCARWLLALANKSAFWLGACTCTWVQQCKPQAKSRIILPYGKSKPGWRCVGPKMSSWNSFASYSNMRCFFNTLAIYGHDVAIPLAKQHQTWLEKMYFLGP